MPNAVETLAAAKQAGLRLALDGADLIVTGFKRLEPAAAAHWRSRLRTEKAALVDSLRGKDNPSAVILRQLGVKVVYVTSHAVAKRIVDRLVADSSGTIFGLDVETMAQVSEIERRRQAEHQLAEIEGRVRGLKRVGKGTEAAVAAAEAKVLRQVMAHAADAALDANRAQVRLVQVYPGGDEVYVFDMRSVGWVALTPLWSQRLAAHGAGFELKNLAAAGIVPEHPVECTMQMSGLLLGTHRRSLLSASSEYLNLSISKVEQTSDWSAPNLSQAQLDYAGLDAVLVVKLAAKMLPALGTMRDAYLLQRDAQAAVAEMERRGVLLDIDAHAALVNDLRAERAEWVSRYLAACRDMGRPDLVAAGVPETPEGKRALLTELLTEDERRNWKTTPKDGKLSTSKVELLRGAHYPPIAALAQLSGIDKLTPSFGPTLAAQVSPITNRLHPSYWTAGAKSGRARVSDPPIQQIPKDPRFRRLLRAAPGCGLVGADFSSMELRAAAHISGDHTMTQVFENGLDLHTITAAAITGKPVSEIDPDGEDRDNAKRVNFGAAYGMGADALVQAAWKSYGRVILRHDAESWLRAFRLKYAQFAGWCQDHARRCEARGYIVIGRDAMRGVGRVFRFAWNRKIDQKKYTQSCNLPIQGQCADAAMLALVLIVRLLKENGISRRSGALAARRDRPRGTARIR